MCCYMFCVFSIHSIPVPWCQIQFLVAWRVKQYGSYHSKSVGVVFFFFSSSHFFSVMDIGITLKFCASYIRKSLWSESAVFSVTCFKSSQYSLGPVGCLGLCGVYKAMNKWNKLNMDIITHSQSAAGPQGFQVAWGFYWSVTRSQLLLLLEQVLFYSVWLASLPTSYSLSKWLFNESDEANDGQFSPLGPTMSFTQDSRLSCGGILPQCVFRLQIKRYHLQASMIKRQLQHSWKIMSQINFKMHLFRCCLGNQVADYQRSKTYKMILQVKILLL